MSRYSLESRVSKLEKEVEKQAERAERVEMTDEEFYGRLVIPYLWDIKEMPLEPELLRELDDNPRTKEMLLGFKEILKGHDACREALDGWNQYVPAEIKEIYPTIPHQIYQIHRKAVEEYKDPPNVWSPRDSRHCYGCQKEDLRQKVNLK